MSTSVKETDLPGHGGRMARSWAWLVLAFGFPTLLNLIAARVFILWIASMDRMPIEAAYFLSVGSLVLAPMLALAWFLTRKELESNSWRSMMVRWRINPLSGRDWLWIVAGFVVMCLASWIIAAFMLPAIGMTANPFFFQNMPLVDSYPWLIACWPAFFFFNIFGEELYWRGYIFPRQQEFQGNWTFLVHGTFWAIWHLPMGLDLVIAALPGFYILSAIVQICKNTSVAIVIHTIFGAFGFLTLAFGLIR